MEDQKKRGDKQLAALKIINELKEDETFEVLTSKVGAECFPEKANNPVTQESCSRHLVRYILRYQDEKDTGKTCTLRAQGREIDGWVSKTETGWRGQLIAAGPNTRRAPTKKVEATTPVVRATPARLDTIRQVAKSLNAKKATEQIEALAKAGAHRFSNPQRVPNEAPVTKETETEGA